MKMNNQNIKEIVEMFDGSDVDDVKVNVKRLPEKTYTLNMYSVHLKFNNDFKKRYYPDTQSKTIAFYGTSFDTIYIKSLKFAHELEIKKLKKTLSKSKKQ